MIIWDIWTSSKKNLCSHLLEKCFFYEFKFVSDFPWGRIRIFFSERSHPDLVNLRPDPNLFKAQFKKNMSFIYLFPLKSEVTELTGVRVSPWYQRRRRWRHVELKINADGYIVLSPWSYLGSSPEEKMRAVENSISNLQRTIRETKFFNQFACNSLIVKEFSMDYM